MIKMNLCKTSILLLGLLSGLVGANANTNTIVGVAQRIMDETQRKRNLLQYVYCSDVADLTEHIFGMALPQAFQCNVGGYNPCVVNCQSQEICCSDICGHYDHRVEFNLISGSPLSEESWYYYRSGMGLLNGKTRYGKINYCSNGGVCSCSVGIEGENCISCTICDEYIPGTNIQYTTFDCSNIEEASILGNYECADLDTGEELEEIAQTFKCDDPQYDLWSGSDTSIVLTALGITMMNIFLLLV